MSAQELARKKGLVSEILSEINSEAKSVADKAETLETKANEVEHTTNTGYGAEFVRPTEVSSILSMIPTYSRLLPVLPGSHGFNLPKSLEVPVAGETGLFTLASEWTTGAPSGLLAQGTNKAPTAKVTISPKKLRMTVDVSEEQLLYAITDMKAWIQNLLAQSAARTIDHMVINGDTATALNTNINLIDGTPTGNEAYLGFDGLRKQALTDGAKVDMGTADFGDLNDLTGQLGDLAANPEDCLFLFNRQTYNKFRGIDEFRDASVNGRGSTVNTGSVTNILGSDVLINRDLTKANNAGKIPAAGGTLGQVLFFHKTAVQYGFGAQFRAEVVDVPSYGIQIVGWFHFGAAMASKKAGQTDPSVALGYNVTL